MRKVEQGLGQLGKGKLLIVYCSFKFLKQDNRRVTMIKTLCIVILKAVAQAWKNGSNNISTNLLKMN